MDGLTPLVLKGTGFTLHSSKRVSVLPCRGLPKPDSSLLLEVVMPKWCQRRVRLNGVG